MVRARRGEAGEPVEAPVAASAAVGQVDLGRCGRGRGSRLLSNVQLIQLVNLGNTLAHHASARSS